MKYDYETLSTLRLSTLRVIGSEMGVKAPTTLKKQDLILAIINVSSGATPPCFNKLGRPRLEEGLDPSKLRLSSKEKGEVQKLRLEQALDEIFNDFKKKLFEIL